MLMSSALIIKVQQILYVVQFTMSFCITIFGVPKIIFFFHLFVYTVLFLLPLNYLKILSYILC
jgi:hypothetical protein